MAKIVTANPSGTGPAPVSEKEQKNVAIHALRDSMIRNKPLTGIVSAIDHVDDLDYVTVQYQGVPVIIPVEKMGFTETAMSDKHRMNVTANSMAGAEIDFIVVHVDQDRGVATASREAAMKQKAKDFFVGDGDRPPIVSVGSLVEARIIGVMDYSIRLEVLGIEKYVRSRDLNREWISDCREKYEVGGTLVVKITDIKTEGGKIDIGIEGVNLRKPYKTSCKVGGRYVGEVTGYSEGRFFIHLDEGTNALAHTSAGVDYIPKRKDIVAFVVTKVLTENNVDTVTGKIVRVIRRYRGN